MYSIWQRQTRYIPPSDILSLNFFRVQNLLSVVLLSEANLEIFSYIFISLTVKNSTPIIFWLWKIFNDHEPLSCVSVHDTDDKKFAILYQISACIFAFFVQDDDPSSEPRLLLHYYNILQGTRYILLEYGEG